MIHDFLLDALNRGWLTVCGILIMGLGLGQILSALGDQDRKIQMLGERAPRIGWRWSSLGLDMLWSSVQHARQYRHLIWWTDKFSKWGTPGRPWTFETQVLGTRIVYTMDPENIQAVLATQFDDFDKGESVTQGYHEFLGRNFATTDGQEWWDYRKLVRPHLVKRAISDLDILEQKVHTFLPLLSSSDSVNATDLFTRLSLDAFTASFLGHCVNSLGKHDQAFATAFREVQRVQNLLCLAGPLKMFIPTQSFYDGLKVLNDFVQPIVDRTISLKERHDKEQNKKATFLHTLSEFTSDRNVIRDQVIVLLIAGRDATSATLSWMFYHLGLQPDLVARLRNEVLEKVGQRRPTFEELKSMTLLQHTIYETLRLYPPLPFSIREAVRDTTLPCGGGIDGLSPIGIPKGTPVAYSTLCLHRMSNQDPLTPGFPDWSEFAPDRWAVWTPEKNHFIPFSAGRRACIGHEFAMTHMTYVTTRILQTYVSINLRMEQKPELDCSTLLRPSRDIRLGFRRC